MNRRLLGLPQLVIAAALLAGVLVPGTQAASAEALVTEDTTATAQRTDGSVPDSDPVEGTDSIVTTPHPQGGPEDEPDPSIDVGPDTPEPAEDPDAHDPETPSTGDSRGDSDTQESPAGQAGLKSPDAAAHEPAESDAEALLADTEEERALESERRAAELAAQHGAITSRASASSGFKAGYIISDANFYNGRAMSAAQIQEFLNRQVPRCELGDKNKEMGKPWGSTTLAWACLKDAKWNTTKLTRAGNDYCKAYTGSASESSATVIAKVAEACGISPRVLLVMLEKEQSLVTDRWPSARQFDRAMGYNCPDSGPNNSANCNPKDTGFMQQVYRSAWQLKVYRAHPENYRYKPFQNNRIQWHPNLNCGTSPVYIENWATAALYIYTPYRPNQAALNAGWGEGDSCSSYGNRNFYQFYKQWFGTPNTFFPDVPTSHQFYKEIEWMGTSGLSTGIKTSDGRASMYQPKTRVSREAMAAFLYRMEGAKYRGPAVSPFADVKRGDPFYNEIAWMHHMGYSTGIKQASGKPKYAPKDRVSREAMAAFIYRLERAKYVGPATSPFADIRKGDKFYNEIAWMHKMRYSTGMKQPSGKPKYAPKDRVSREAMAAFIYRLKH